MKSIEARGNDTTIYGTKVSQLPYMAQTCPQNILSVTFQNQSSVRHNIPQASNETFPHVVQKLDSWLAQASDGPTLSLFMIVTKLLLCAPFESLGSNVNKYGGFKSSYLRNSR